MRITLIEDNIALASGKADQTLALERFSQVGNSSGSGLGLPIAKQAVESNGGRFMFEPSDKGLRVALLYPSQTVMA